MFFSKNASQNPLLLQHLLCARSVLSFDHHTHLLAPTTPLGIALRHFRECMSTTGGREQWIHLSETLTFCQIWESIDPNLRCGKMLGVLPGRFTAPYPRWWTYTPGNASGQSLGVLWGLCGHSGTAGRVHRRCCTKHRFWDNVFEKNMHVLVTDFISTPDLEGSEGRDQKSAQFNLFYGHPNT